MRPLDFPLLTDENIHPCVMDILTAQGKDVRSVQGEGFGGREDVDILRHAHTQGRVVLTHDADFGTLVMATGEPFTGIVYLRPGHISSVFVLKTLEAIETSGVEVSVPFLLVAERRADHVRIRLRSTLPLQ